MKAVKAGSGLHAVLRELLAVIATAIEVNLQQVRSQL